MSAANEISIKVDWNGDRVPDEVFFKVPEQKLASSDVQTLTPYYKDQTGRAHEIPSLSIKAYADPTQSEQLSVWGDGPSSSPTYTDASPAKPKYSANHFVIKADAPLVGERTDGQPDIVHVITDADGQAHQYTITDNQSPDGRVLQSDLDDQLWFWQDGTKKVEHRVTMAYSHHQPFIDTVGDIIFHEPPHKDLHIDVSQYGTETVTKTYDPQAIEGDNGYLTPGYADGEITVSKTSPVPLHMAPVYLSSGLDLDDVAHQWELKVIQKSKDPIGKEKGTRIDETGTVYTMVIDGDGKTVRVGPHQLKDRAANVHERYQP